MLIVELDNELVFPIIELLMGGAGTPVEAAGRDLSEIEEDIMLDVSTLLARQAEAVWRVPNLSLVPGARIKPTLMHHCFAPSEKVAVLRFGVEIAGTTGSFKLVLPTELLNVLMSQINREQPQKDARVWSFPTPPLRERILDCDFEVSSELTGLKVAVRDLIALQPGSVLKLRAPIRNPGVLSAGGRGDASKRCRSATAPSAQRNLVAVSHPQIGRGDKNHGRSCQEESGQFLCKRVCSVARRNGGSRDRIALDARSHQGPDTPSNKGMPVHFRLEVQGAISGECFVEFYEPQISELVSKITKQQVTELTDELCEGLAQVISSATTGLAASLEAKFGALTFKVDRVAGLAFGGMFVVPLAVSESQPHEQVLLYFGGQLLDALSAGEDGEAGRRNRGTRRFFSQSEAGDGCRTECLASLRPAAVASARGAGTDERFGHRVGSDGR